MWRWISFAFEVDEMGLIRLGAANHCPYHGGVGRACGVGRGLGVALGVAVGGGVTVGVPVGLGVGVAVGVTVGVGVILGVGVGVGVGVDPPCAQYLPPVSRSVKESFRPPQTII